MNDDPQANSDIKDPTLLALSQRLDRLGADARSEPSDLEETVLAAVGAAIAPEPIAMPDRRAWWRSGTLRLAAGIALLAGVCIPMYVAQRSSSELDAPVITAAALEDQIDGLFVFDQVGGGSSFDDSLASIELWADAIDTESLGGWSETQYVDDWFGEGAL